MSHDEKQLASDLALAVVRLARQLRGHRQHSAVSLTQLSALSTLFSEGPMTPGALAARERVQPPSMTRVIGSLADVGLVDRMPHPSDGRQIIVSLSEAGKALVQNEKDAREAWLAAQLRNLRSAELTSLREAVDTMTELMKTCD
ncbi:MarR family transcriptional regulator [Hoyosella sp. YIM 151337]|uniref:MarR family winged helix-turn-helix transcriptional regulator n=1 Tax=Hoyosella sp. YIM 151337 TaxID=2992742 RepID=UPI0022369628|nr:MarR family transcriptional regulator [Hoyosella sp. YIM 151337]MCW4356010.1 MarR family transcriptional regulator [Hoyosella sp. YIM 151337]